MANRAMGAHRARPSQKRQGDQGEQGADAKAGVGAAGIGHLTQHFQPRTRLFRIEGKHSVRGGRDCLFQRLLPTERPSLLPRLRCELLQPKPLGPPVAHGKTGPLSLAAAAHPHRFPTAGLIAGARIALRIGECLGQQRTGAKGFPPLLGQRPAGDRQNLGSPIRFPGPWKGAAESAGSARPT